MSQAKPRSELQRKAYLQRVLKMNPLSDAEHVMALRNRYHRVPTETRSQSETSNKTNYEQRDEVTTVIAKVRQDFWQTDLNDIKERLKQLPLNEFPDLKNAAQRLTVLAENRHLFAQLAANEKFNRGFLNNLKEILILSQKEAAELKDNLLQKLSIAARAKHVRRSLKILEKHAPEIYALEAEWFDILKTTKPQAISQPSRVHDESSSSDDSGTGWGWAVWIIVVIVIRILGAMARG